MAQPITAILSSNKDEPFVILADDHQMAGNLACMRRISPVMLPAMKTSKGLPIRPGASGAGRLAQQGKPDPAMPDDLVAWVEGQAGPARRGARVKGTSRCPITMGATASLSFRHVWVSSRRM